MFEALLGKDVFSVRHYIKVYLMLIGFPDGSNVYFDIDKVLFSITAQ
jgi:hypothetical protein